MEIQLLRSIFLLRHGQEARGTNHRLGGPLTELGRMQAERAGERLRHYPIGAIYASTLRRAAETAGIVAQRLPAARLALTDDLW